MATAQYQFANVWWESGGLNTLSIDRTGTTDERLRASLGAVLDYSQPTVVVGQGGVGNLYAWNNVALAGREFAGYTHTGSTFGILAAGSTATVTVSLNWAVVSTLTVSASGPPQSVDNPAGLMELSSDNDVLVAEVGAGGEYHVPVVPAAQMVFGQCSRYCQISVWGSDTSFPIVQTCTDGTVETVHASTAGFWRSSEVPGSNYVGRSCKWTAPAGHKICGKIEDLYSGRSSVALVPSHYFQYSTPVTPNINYVVLISDSPSQCTYGVNSVTLVGANGVYHARLNGNGAPVIDCDTPVAAIGEPGCPPEFDPHNDCTFAKVNLIALTTTTTTGTTTISTATSSSTTRTTTRTTTATTTTSATGTATTSSTSTGTATTSTILGITSTATTAPSTTTTFTTATSTTTTTTTATSTTTTSTTATSTTTASTTATSTTTTTTTATSTTTTSTTATSTTSPTSTTTSTTMSITSTTTSSNTSTTTSTTSSATNTTSTTRTSTTATLTHTVSTTDPTFATTNELSAAMLVDRVESLESLLLPTLIGENLTSITQRSDGLTLVAMKLDATAVAAAGGDLTVHLEDQEAAVTFPASFFATPGLGAEGVVLTVASVDGNIIIESDVQVAAVVNVNLLRLDGRRLHVSGLIDAIRVVMPVNHTAGGLQCVFWDEDSFAWAAKGVTLGSVDGGSVECNSTHLTLFAAIFRGFVETLACSQVSMLNTESIKELGKGDWHRSVGALALWSLVGIFMLVMSLAAWRDCARWRQGSSSDAHLLIPLRGEQEDGQQGEQPQEDEPQERGSSACAVCSLCWNCCSGPVRDALDEVLSQWFEYLGDIRGLVEGLYEGLDLQSGGVLQIVDTLLCTTLVTSARRQAAASLGISWDASALVMEDEHILNLLADRTRRQHDDDVARGISATTSAREEVWHQLHRDVEAKLDEVMEAAGRWSSIPGTVWRLFLHQNSLSASLVHCSFTSSKQRVLLFMVDVAGGLTLATLFHSAVGTPSKRSRNFGCEFDDPAQFIGRIVAIGMSSALLSGIPAAILGSLCTRAVKKVDCEGGPEWTRQLTVWNIQDKAIWILAFLYLAFCALFISLFLANVTQTDHVGWLLSLLISVLEDIVVIPLTVALVLTFLTTACLNVMSRQRRATKKELISQVNLQFKASVRMNMAVGNI